MPRHPLARRGRHSLAALEAETKRKIIKGAIYAGGAFALYMLLRPKPAKGSPIPKPATGKGTIQSSDGSPIAARADFAAAYGPMTTYKVQPFDSLTKIAEAVFGRKELFAYLADINYPVVSNPNKISLGSTLLIPTHFPEANVDAYAARYAALVACYAAGSCKVPPPEVMAFTAIPL